MSALKPKSHFGKLITLTEEQKEDISDVLPFPFPSTASYICSCLRLLTQMKMD